MGLLRTSRWFPFFSRIKSVLFQSYLNYSPALILYSGHCEPSLIIWIYICPCSHLTLYLGKSGFYWPISRGACSHLRRWMPFLCTFLTHVPFCTFTTSDVLLNSGIYWAWAMAICIQYKLPLLFFYNSAPWGQNLYFTHLYHLPCLEQCLACNRCLQNMCGVETINVGRCHCIIKRELHSLPDI